MRRRIISVLVALAVAVTMAPVIADTAFAETDTPYVICKASVSGNRAVKLTWNKTVGATKYIIYASKYGKSCRKIKTVRGNSYTVKKIKGKKLKAHNVYKFYVKAYKGTTKLATSRTLRFITAKTKGKYANASKITAMYSSKSLLVGSKCKLGANIKIYKGKKHLPVKYGRISFESSRPGIASVSSDGTVTAKEEGSAKIYIQDISGIYATTTVTVTDPVKTLARAKAEAKAAITEAAGQDASEAVKAIVSDYTKDGGIIDQQETVEAVKCIQNEAVQMINSQKDTEARLAEAKKQTKAMIKALCGEENLSDEVKAIIEKYTKDGGLIDQQDSFEGVETMKYECIEKVIEATQLEHAKTIAKKTIKEAAGQNASDAVKAISEDYTKDGGIIDRQETVKAVNDKQKEAVEKIKAQKDAETELAKAKAKAKVAVEEAAGQDASDAVKAIASEYTKDGGLIDQQGTVEDVEYIQKEAVDKIKVQQEAEARLAEAKQQTKDMIKTVCGENLSDEVKAIIKKYTDDGGIIDQQGTVEDVETMKYECIKEVILKTQSEQLERAKTIAKETIKKAAGQNPSDAVNAIVSEYTKAGGVIDQQETLDGVIAKQQEAVDKIKEQQDADLEKTKAAAKEAIENQLKKHDGGNTRMLYLADKAKGEIDKAKTIDEVNKLKEDCIKAIEEAVPSEGFEVFYSFDKQFMIADKEMQWDAAMSFAKSKGGHVASVAELNRLRNADMATLKPDEYYWDMKIYKRLKNNVLWTCQKSHGFWAEGDSVAYIYNSGGTNNHSRSIEESVIIIKD